MQNLFKRLLALLLGLFLYALGIVLCVQANIGCAPWDVLHMGLARFTGWSMGQMSISVGALICVLVLLLHEKLGLGTILNMLLIGEFMDLIFIAGVIPLLSNMWLGIVMMIAGLFIIAFGTYFYIGVGFGAGPRDSLMVAVQRRLKIPVGACRAIVEGIALLTGFFLGGQAGVGTIIAVFGIGICVQIVFKLLKFDPAMVEHETLHGTWKRLVSK